MDTRINLTKTKQIGKEYKMAHHRGYMTFGVNSENNVHQVTHLEGDEENGITLYIPYDEVTGSHLPHTVVISLAEFKDNNPRMFEDMERRRKEQNGE